MTLDQLLIRAEVRQYFRALYFAGCTLQTNVLLVPDRQLGETIARQFGPDLRRVVSDLTIRVAGPVTVPALPLSLKKSAAKWHQAQQAKLPD